MSPSHYKNAQGMHSHRDYGGPEKLLPLLVLLAWS